MGVRCLLALRWVSLLGVVAAFLGSVVMFLIGAFRVITGTVLFVQSLFDLAQPLFQGINPRNLVVSELIGSLDAFLFALTLMIFAYGVYFLFIANADEHARLRLPRWVRVENIGELKNTLAQLIIILLIGEFLETAIITGTEILTWNALILPTAVLLPAGALRLMNPSCAQG